MVRFFSLTNFFFIVRHAAISLLLSTPAPAELVFILLPEAVSGGEEVPAALLVHVPDVRLLSRVLSLVLVDQVHQEETEIRKELEMTSLNFSYVAN